MIDILELIWIYLDPYWNWGTYLRVCKEWNLFFSRFHCKECITIILGEAPVLLMAGIIDPQQDTNFWHQLAIRCPHRLCEILNVAWVHPIVYFLVPYNMRVQLFFHPNFIHDPEKCFRASLDLDKKIFRDVMNLYCFKSIKTYMASMTPAHYEMISHLKIKNKASFLTEALNLRNLDLVNVLEDEDGDTETIIKWINKENNLDALQVLHDDVRFGKEFTGLNAELAKHLPPPPKPLKEAVVTWISCDPDYSKEFIDWYMKCFHKSMWGYLILMIVTEIKYLRKCFKARKYKISDDKTLRRLALIYDRDLYFRSLSGLHFIPTEVITMVQCDSVKCASLVTRKNTNRSAKMLQAIRKETPTAELLRKTFLNS